MALAEYESEWIFITVKRFFDLILGVVVFVLLVAPMLLIVIIIRLTSKGSALYWSDRVGKNNKIFRVKTT